MRRRGIALMDVVVSSALLAMVALLVLNLYPTSYLSIRQAQNRTLASDCARSILEEYRVRPFEELTPGATFTPAPQTQDALTLSPAVKIEAVPGSEPSRLVQVTASVNWSDATGSHSLSYSTYVYHLPH